MDGHFVPNISFGCCVLSSITKNSGMFVDVHLMVERPKNFIEQFCKNKASSITFHIESYDDPLDCIKLIRSFDLKCGIAVSPKTKIEKVIPYIDLVDMILVMTVNPGFSGQNFIEEMLEKVRYIRSLKPSLTVEVDGGINEINIKKASEAGANWFVAGSYVFNSKDYFKSLDILKEAATF